MEEKKKEKRGGKREGAGRKATGITTKAMSLKIDLDIYAALNGVANKNRYINEAVRKAMHDDGILF